MYRINIIILLLLLSVKYTAFSTGAEKDILLCNVTAQKILSVALEGEAEKYNIKVKVKQSEAADDVFTRKAFNNGYKIYISSEFLKQIVAGNEDILAFSIGHEVSHILLGHLDAEAKTETAFLEKQYTKEEEFAADKLGMRLALKAGYSYRAIIENLKKFISLGMEYSSIEGISKEHPPWSERLRKLDSSQSALWDALGAYENGNTLLYLEQYTNAERCFKHVVEEFPSYAEAWNNLGYSQLMDYLSKFGTSDFENYNIGHIVTGSFYNTSGTTRGGGSLFSQIDEELWYDAVGSLMEAVRLNPKLTLAKSNLGLAYLMHPGGKDLGRATKYFSEALELAENDTTLDFLSLSALYINAGVTEMAEKPVAGNIKMDKAQEYERRFAEKSAKNSQKYFMQINEPITYNKAMMNMMSGSDSLRKIAAGQFLDYLKKADFSSPWWSTAYENYQKLCNEFDMDMVSDDSLIRSTSLRFRPLSSYQVDDSTVFSWSDRTDKLLNAHDDFVVINIVPKTNISLIKSDRKGISLLAGNVIFGIIISDKGKPACYHQ